MGSVFSILSILASSVLVILPESSPQMFYVLVAILASYGVAAFLRGNPGLFAAAVLLGWFAIMIVAPFSLTDRQANALARVARRGDEEAQALLDFYATLAPFALWLQVAIAVLLLVLFIIGTRRAPVGAHRYMMDASNGLQAFVERVGIAAALLFVPMMLIIVYDVLQRKYLGFDPGFTNTEWYKIFTSTKLQEMEWHLHGALFLMTLGYGYVKDSHVRIELVRDMLRPRTRVWIELLGAILFMVPYCYVIMQYGSEMAIRSYDIGESSAAQTGLDHRFIIKSLLPLGFTLLALAGMSVALKCVVYLFGPPSLREESGFYAGTQHAIAPVKAA
ncbi:TRAP transporter small permease subunit [Roseicitreum antarcticum]|uniref:TRAP transporter small permease protein n=1 Tax=Roseicitreum antarcticum TaxID=564137 RepID=A0A1H2ZPM6_9RHOB|nr:TRAP transporter small permease subunit [Roseicitreum antarcticum]SDX19472.1 TRAP-type mannitol/chloroaromatic compound transport system, small permease component [Roseicitreum antarcticum]